MPIKCIHQNCTSRPSYNLPTEKKSLYCKEHKKDNMIIVKNRQCNNENCNKQASYNISTENIPLYCKEHIKENMIDIRSKRCLYENCNRGPSYNLPTEKTPLYCKEHKQDNMVNVKSYKCLYENCPKRPSYNIPTKKTALYCKEHKQDDMIDVKHKKCAYENCTILPSFNLPTEKTPLYCGEHKQLSMINLGKKNCQKSKCKELAIFGFKDKKPYFCINHRQPKMINLVLENKCSILDCDDEHTDIIDNIKYCNKHIPEDALIKVKRLCKYCDIKEQSDYICNDCKKIQNKKEWAIVRYLRKAIDTKFEYNSSKMLQGCSNKRPDIYFELNKHCVVVEIDENQHNSYEDTCECARINEIVNGIGGKSVIIIRYNPDVVKNKNKVLTINQKDRIDLLVKTIKDEIIKEYDTFIVKIVQLYYNDIYKVYKPIMEENITDKVAL